MTYWRDFNSPFLATLSCLGPWGGCWAYPSCILAAWTPGWVPSSSQGPMRAFGDLGLCSRVPWCSEDVLTTPPATRWTRGLNRDPSLFRRDRAEVSVLFVKLATEINIFHQRVEESGGNEGLTSTESHLGWDMNWNGWDPTFRSKNRSGLSHWRYGRSFQRKYMDPEPERCAQIFKIKWLKGRGLAPKNNMMSERRRGLNLPGQILPVLNRENCRTWPSWGR